MELTEIRKYISYGAFGNEVLKRPDLIPVSHKKLEAFIKEKLLEFLQLE